MHCNCKLLQIQISYNSDLGGFYMLLRWDLFNFLDDVNAKHCNCHQWSHATEKSCPGHKYQLRWFILQTRIKVKSAGCSLGIEYIRCEIVEGSRGNYETSQANRDTDAVYQFPVFRERTERVPQHVNLCSHHCKHQKGGGCREVYLPNPKDFAVVGAYWDVSRHDWD